jgi:hypothetical protein
MEERVLLMTRKWGSEDQSTEFMRALVEIRALPGFSIERNLEGSNEIDLYVSRGYLGEARNILREAGYEHPGQRTFNF